MNITEPIRRNATLAARSVAIAGPEGRAMTYGELETGIEEASARLRDTGLGPGKIAALTVRDPVGALIMGLALARIGAAAAPASFQGGARLTDSATSDGEGSATMVDEQWWLRRAAPTRPPAELHGDASTACRIVWCGGKGQGRMMAVSHELVTRRIFKRWFASRLPDDPRQACFIDAESEFALSSVLRVLWKRGMVVIARDAESLPRAMRLHAANVVVADPATLGRLVEIHRGGSGPLPSLELVEVTNGAVTDEVFEAARGVVCDNIVSIYQTCEAGLLAAAPRAALRGIDGAVGYLLPDVEMRAADQRAAPYAFDTAGLLSVRSDTAMPTDRVSDGTQWLATGDLGRVSSHGVVSVLRGAAA